MSPFLWATSSYQKYAIAYKSGPIGKKSPNLVTLIKENALLAGFLNVFSPTLGLHKIRNNVFIL